MWVIVHADDLLELGPDLANIQILFHVLQFNNNKYQSNCYGIQSYSITDCLIDSVITTFLALKRTIIFYSNQFGSKLQGEFGLDFDSCLNFLEELVIFEPALQIVDGNFLEDGVVDLSDVGAWSAGYGQEGICHCLVLLEEVVELQLGDLSVGFFCLFVCLSFHYLVLPIFLKLLQFFFNVFQIL